MIVLSFFLLAGGIAALYFGADWLVRGAVRLGVSVGLSPIVIGLTIVSFGTSAPELVVCIVAALGGNGDLAVGNIIGSNLANIGLVLGITAMITPLRVAKRVVRREVPMMLFLTVLAYPLLIDERISRTDGLLLVVLLVLYLIYLLRVTNADKDPEVAHGFESLVEETASLDAEALDRTRKRKALWSSIGLVVIGAVALTLGGQLIVRAAVQLAEAAGLSQLFIGLTVIAIGTSLPELATSILAAMRRETDIAVGNIIGSNIFNLTAVLGVASIVAPFEIVATIMAQEYLAMLLLSVLILPVAWRSFCIQRWEGGVLVLAYLGIFWWLFT